MKFEIAEFYPSISEQLLNHALDLGKKYENITDD